MSRQSMLTSSGARLISLAWGDRSVDIEYVWVGASRVDAPLVVFLHEGLGSLAMWREFPARLCEQVSARGLVYSRPGYGRSTPRPSSERWGADFMHRQALEVLPALFKALGIDAQQSPPWLFGHSDGGSMALLHAAHRPDHTAGLIVLAPHILVEDVSVHSIQKARDAYLNTDLRERLARYHDNPDSAFWGWNDVWLDPGFRSWSIETELASIRCPVLAVQGLDDEYGTLAQVRGIAVQAPQTELLELPACGHSPHRDQAEAVIGAVQRFMAAHRA